MLRPCRTGPEKRVRAPTTIVSYHAAAAPKSQNPSTIRPSLRGRPAGGRDRTMSFGARAFPAVHGHRPRWSEHILRVPERGLQVVSWNRARISSRRKALLFEVLVPLWKVPIRLRCVVSNAGVRADFPFGFHPSRHFPGRGIAFQNVRLALSGFTFRLIRLRLRSFARFLDRAPPFPDPRAQHGIAS